MSTQKHVAKFALMMLLTGNVAAKSIKDVLWLRLRLPGTYDAKVLDLSKKGITSLDGLERVARKYPHLERLELSDNAISEVPSTIKLFTNLRSLRLRNNQLSTLPEELAHLTQLRVLRLSGNKFRIIPPAITALHGLRSLTLNNNKIIAMPLEISRLRQLRELHLQGNRIAAIPQEIKKLKHLKTLDLIANLLSPAEIQKLEHLLPMVQVYTHLQRVLLKPNVMREDAPTAAFEECSICLDKVSQAGEQFLNYNTKCEHFFHTTCLQQHLVKSRTLVCPLCRANILTGEKAK